MFRKNQVLLAAALLAAAPAPALLAQGQGAPGAAHQQHGDRQQRQGSRPSPVAALLEHRAELKLTDAQVSRLQTIERDLAQKNEPLRRQLEAARPQRAQGDQERPSEEERQAMRARMEQLRPQMQQLRQNQQAAMEQVRTVLTDEQEQAARRYLRGPRGERGERGERGARGEGGGRGERGRQAPRSR